MVDDFKESKKWLPDGLRMILSKWFFGLESEDDADAGCEFKEDR